MSALVVFSHLRWDFVFQRPQHLMTRFARHDRVLFIEEPVFDERPAFLELVRASENVFIARPHTPLRAPGFHDDQLAILPELIAEAIERARVTDYSVWFYTPMALPLLGGLHPQAIIYDCMDELSAFSQAPRQLLQREAVLLKVANVVFTGGPGLYDAKHTHNPAVHCFPSSVDAEHFARGRDSSHASPALQHIAHPRLGFFGVIDERLDLDLIAFLADAHAEWQICIVGPIVKIDAANLPRRANIHYFPQQKYADLPSFLAAWDVCLLPFALNEATRFISPTKTLEYMAAERPVVSTPISDVARLYGDAVHIAKAGVDFVRACEQALAETSEAANERRARMRKITANTSWDRTADEMQRLIAEARRNGIKRDARELLASTRERAVAEAP